MRYRSDDSFIGKYQKLVKDNVIPYQLDILYDKAEGAEKSHVVKNFINAAKALRGEDVDDGFYGMVFQDSDMAKWIEAASYSLISFPDSILEAKVDEMVELVAAAQDKDGYLNTYFTIKDREKRWTNLQEGHELYCSGHMMEAGCAYFEATGKDKLLNVCIKNMECIYNHFITEENPGYPGHPEVELALLKMYNLTGNKHCLELAKHFIDVRGVDPDFYQKEWNARNWSVWGANPGDPGYMQADMPVRAQTQAKGHAVRAVYLYTAMAELAAKTDDTELKDAVHRLWESITERQMYITGGIGQTVHGEAFSVDYDLPSDTAYCETCASIGLMFFADKMQSIEINSRYSDVSERAFYNTILAGMQLDGRSFFYVNPLESNPKISGVAPTHRHDLTRRFKWHACACCPPNAARLISSIGKYAFSEDNDTSYVHLFVGGAVDYDNGLSINIDTQYPFDFTINISVEKGRGRLMLRIPGYASGYSLSINGEKIVATEENGYAIISVATSDKITYIIDCEPQMNYASNNVPRLSGLTAISYGPLVYCFEGNDNDDLYSILLQRQGDIKTIASSFMNLEHMIKIQVPAKRIKGSSGLYYTNPSFEDTCATAIPYFAWCNREESGMKVWMPTI